MRSISINKTFLVAITALVVSSCIGAQRSPSQALDSFVDKTELNCKSYTPEEWEKSATQYEKLVEQYTNSNKQYTEAEKQMAARAMGRYHALLIKHGLEKSSSYLKELGNLLPSYLDGLSDEIGEGTSDIESTLEDIFDEEKIEKSLERLGSALEDLFGGND